MLLQWLETPNQRGVHVAEGDDRWSYHSYADLSVDVRGFAAGLAATGAEPGEVVSLMVAEPRNFIVAFMGTLAAGMVPSPLAPPRSLRGDRYPAHLARVFSVAQPSVVIADDDVRAYAQTALAESEVDAWVLPPEPAAGIEPIGAAVPRAPEDLALLQFTSGSSGNPKGVRVTWGNLAANTRAIRDWMHWVPEDVFATWLPLHHDMGLVGAMITPVISGTELWIMTPEQFIRTPRRWLDCFGHRGATLTTAPSFGYSYCARRVKPDQLAGSDYSNWRIAILGAERIDPVALHDFCNLVRPYGFDEGALVGAYGLAETTLAVTGVAPGARSPLVRPAAAGADLGQPIEIDDIGVLGLDRADGSWLSGCGTPIGDLSVRIIDEQGRTLPDGTFGEIVVSGSSVAEGYLEAGGKIVPFAPDGLHTGDGGFVWENQLYVVGRMTDSLKVRGTMLFAEDLEAQLARLEGLSGLPAVVLLGRHGDRDHAVLLVEDTGARAWLDSAVATLRAATTAEVNLSVLCGKRGAIDRTSSGKPRRRVLWRQLVAGPTAKWEPVHGVGPGQDDNGERPVLAALGARPPAEAPGAR